MSFLRTLHAEWTKLRTVRGWVIGLLAAALVIIALGLTPSRAGSCGQHGPGSECTTLHGPEGQEVTDSATYVHRTLTGDGSITVRLAGLTGQLPTFDGGQTREGLAPWAKAGLMVRDGTRAGAAYAAVMLTGEHGVRMQYNYVHDTGGPAGAKVEAQPVWLRLTRTGDTVKAEQSADGATWAEVGTARLPGLPATVTAGMFATSPQYSELVNESVVLSGISGGPSIATGAFERPATTGASSADWESDAAAVEPESAEQPKGGGTTARATGPRTGFQQTADGWLVTGSGDVGPAVSGASGGGVTISQTLVGTFLGLMVVVVVGAMFAAAEYRRGLIRTTLAAVPRRGRVLAAKALVLGGVTFGLGLAAAAVVVTFGQDVLRDNGVYVKPASTLTELRVAAGTALLLAGCAALAAGLGVLLRRGVTAVAAAIVVVVLPYLLSVTVLPLRASAWVLSVTPAAAFSLQQSEPQYDQVDNIYSPADGYFPLSAWGGLAVLAVWVAVVLAGAGYVQRRRDA
ncbi:ABC transporter permease subunit [Dactylosporangium vinaceum]|uniref:ABC transporter permease subunit n=1 Tax=Dactylosporangium vinaceum TaxID=53362 RepID=A0ABV5MBW8_9ACTN|nr:ABC transporter permease subunit [Dactylosporangium vinaceum]UAC01315.1 ABC transporter permease subunit [Dactylosporangium vinaceum]